MAISGLSLLLGILFAYLGILLVWYTIYVIANWKIFSKAGESGWKAIIPIYNTYISFKISWNTKMFGIMLGCMIVSGILVVFNNTVIATLCSAAGIIISIIGIVQTHMLSKAFGHGIGFTLGLIFLNPIFVMILGFGSSEYQGPQGF